MKSNYSIKDITNDLNPVFSYYNVKKAVLFGSYSKGMASDNSDIDLLVDSRLKGLQFVGLIEDIRVAVGKKVDVLDITHIDENSVIKKEIEDNGIVIYEE